MPGDLMKFVMAFAPLYSKPIFKRVKVLVTGAILSPASRTVTNALRVMGFSHGRNLSKQEKLKIRQAVPVLQKGRYIFRCDWVNEATNMAVAEFSKIGGGGRDDKNTAPIS